MFNFRKLRLANRDVMSLQDNVDEVFRALAVSPFADGVLIEGIVFKASPAASLTQRINHGLQRMPRGWITVDRTGTATVYRSVWTDRILTLVASTDLTLSIWVF